jgi:phosphoglycerate dehydrogenase-like enzyme
LTLHKTREQLADAVNHLSLHVPSTKETNGICNENLLQRLGPSGHIVNTSRGALIDQKALLDSLNGQGTRWASLDVFQSEPPVDDVSKDLMLHPRVTATPHVAYLSSQSTERLRRLAGAKLRSLLDESAST